MIAPLLMISKANPCGNAPSISAHVASEQQAPVCPTTDWITRSAVTTGTLGSFKIERQRATDSGGTGWTAWVTSQNANEDYSHPDSFGAGGAGPSETHYFKARARIVSGGGIPCSGWTESNGPISHTDNGCQE